MKDIKQNLVKMTKRNDVIVAVVMLLYILVEVDMPNAVNDIVNSNMGAGLLVISVIYLFLKVNNPVMTVLAIIAVYELMRRAKHSYRVGKVVGIESSKNVVKPVGSSLRNHEYTLEEFVAGQVIENDRRKQGLLTMLSLYAVLQQMHH